MRERETQADGQTERKDFNICICTYIYLRIYPYVQCRCAFCCDFHEMCLHMFVCICVYPCDLFRIIEIIKKYRSNVD